MKNNKHTFVLTFFYWTFLVDTSDIQSSNSSLSKAEQFTECKNYSHIVSKKLHNSQSFLTPIFEANNLSRSSSNYALNQTHNLPNNNDIFPMMISEQLCRLLVQNLESNLLCRKLQPGQNMGAVNNKPVLYQYFNFEQ